MKYTIFFIYTFILNVFILNFKTTVAAENNTDNICTEKARREVIKDCLFIYLFICDIITVKAIQFGCYNTRSVNLKYPTPRNTLCTQQFTMYNTTR